MRCWMQCFGDPFLKRGKKYVMGHGEKKMCLTVGYNIICVFAAAYGILLCIDSENTEKLDAMQLLYD